MERLTNRKINGVRNFTLPDALKTRSLMYQKLGDYEDAEEAGRIKPSDNDVVNNMFDKLIELVTENYNSVACGWTSARSRGNYDDCFDDGFTAGQSLLAYNVGVILGLQLEEPEPPDYIDEW